MFALQTYGLTSPVLLVALLAVLLAVFGGAAYLVTRRVDREWADAERIEQLERRVADLERQSSTDD